MYSAAKTVTDCFKFRDKIGLDVALEGLKDARCSRKVTMADLGHFAQINRVERVVQPYLKAIESVGVHPGPVADACQATG